MDSDGRLGLSCIQRGWRFSQLDEDVFFFDEQAEYLARVDKSFAERLRGDLPAGSLNVVLREFAQRRQDSQHAIEVDADSV